MKMNSRFALALTFVCALMILGAGYLGISQGGKLLLHNESAPELAAYENTSSNVFYGKIEDDIALYPWNYYSEEGPIGYPQFGMFYIKNNQELECIFQDLIAENTGVSLEAVSEYYQARPIVENLKTGEDDNGLQYYFFQDTPELNGKKYQVKIACDNWNIQSVICNEVRSDEVQNTEKWKQGKEILTEVLEKNQEELGEQMELMVEFNNGYLGEGNYSELTRIIFGIINSIVSGNEEEYKRWVEDRALYCDVYDSENLAAIDGAYTTIALGFSYQILERSDVILLLLQSDSVNIALYYDPIAVKFCGYNFL